MNTASGSSLLEPEAAPFDDDPLEAAYAAQVGMNLHAADQIGYLHDYLIHAATDTSLVALSGREKMIAYGGTGTPEVPEFAVAQIGARLGLSPDAAQRLVADSLSLVYRLPALFAVLQDGAVEVWRARMVASATRALSLEATARVEDAVLADNRTGIPRLSGMSRHQFTHLLDQLCTVEEPETVEDQIAQALSDRDLTIRPGVRGVSDLSGSVSVADGARLHQRLTQVAGWLRETGDQRPLSVLRSVALGMLADPGTLNRLHAQVHAQRTGQLALDDDMAGDDAPELPTKPGPLPATTLYVHHDRFSGTWSLDGAGPLTAAEAADLVGHSAVTIRPVIDLAQNLTYTNYVAPALLREQLRQLNGGYCTFPYCTRPAARGDYDHLQNHDPNAPPGQPGSTCSRYGHLPCRHHHRIKTHGKGWRVISPTPGVWIWTDPHGRIYCVTGGTTTELN